jgi:hypothetical protein
VVSARTRSQAPLWGLGVFVVATSCSRVVEGRCSWALFANAGVVKGFKLSAAG